MTAAALDPAVDAPGASHALTWIAPQDSDEPALLLLRPAGPVRRPMPVAVCVHGYMRQPLDQLEAFAPLAAARGYALALPVFDERRHRRYQQLLHSRRGTRSDVGLLKILSRVPDSATLDLKRLFLFGYSGGAQFVHRFALCHPRRTAALAVGAAGWYTWPDHGQTWPAGLDGMAQALGAPPDLAAFLRLPIAVWVGERDTLADDTLRTEPEILAGQGAHRLERAQRWTEAVRMAAASAGIDQTVQVQTVARAGHDFGTCDRRGALARQVMDFFDAQRARSDVAA